LGAGTVNFLANGALHVVSLLRDIVDVIDTLLFFIFIDARFGNPLCAEKMRVPPVGRGGEQAISPWAKRAYRPLLTLVL